MPAEINNRVAATKHLRFIGYRSRYEPHVYTAAVLLVKVLLGWVVPRAL